MYEVKIKNINISNKQPLTLFAGVCVIENEKNTVYVADYLKDLTGELKIKFVFKASFDKANRSSLKSFRGPGLNNSLKILAKIKEKLDIKLLVDIHSENDIFRIKDIIDIIQIPAFLCRQTDLLLAAGKTGLPVNIKKGQFLSPYEVRNICEKIESTGNKKILLTERGFCFGYNNLVVDMRSIEIMKQTGYPVLFDATHSVQKPGGLGYATGGDRIFIEPLSKAAVSLGIAGLFCEVHKNPDKALSDGPNSIKLSELKKFLMKILQFDKTAKNLQQ